MLVLSRQRDETIMIGDDIEITVVDIRGDKVRLGITAPNTIPVHRKEVYEAIQRENRDAAKVRMEDLSNLPRGVPGKPSAPAAGHPLRTPMRPGRSAIMPVTRPQTSPSATPPHAAPAPNSISPEDATKNGSTGSPGPNP